jgi:AraC family transcriptional regulator
MAMSAFQSSQTTSGVHGRSLGERLGAKVAPSIVTRTLWQAEVAVTDIRVDEPLGRLSAPLPTVDAFIVCLMLRDIPHNAYWEGGRQVSAYSIRAGETTIHDLRREPAAMMDKPLHSLLFYLPSATLSALADQAGVPRINELRYEPGVPILDEAIKHIGLSIMPAFRTPEQINRLFMDYVTLAFASHAAQTYGGMQTATRPLKGGLAPWQEKLSKEMIAGDLTDAKSLHEIANACRISVSHFSRAFRKSTGLAPHTWLLQARVESAKAMLRSAEPSLSEISRACGFADQSHFARVFMRRVGVSPGAWRKTVLD